MDLPYTEICRAHFQSLRLSNATGLTFCNTVGASLTTSTVPLPSTITGKVTGQCTMVTASCVTATTTTSGAHLNTPSTMHRGVSSTAMPVTSAARLFQIALQAARHTDQTAGGSVATDEDGNDRRAISTSSAMHGLPGHTRSVHLTPQQWQTLTDYHEHDLFTRTRSWGFCCAIFGIGIVVFGLGSPAWKWIGDARHPYELGLWAVCYPNTTCLSLVYHLRDDWKIHSSVICLLGCACLFGLLGLALAIAGVCRSALIARLYYYHSAGECFLVSSASIVGALGLYPTSARACVQTLFNHGLIVPHLSANMPQPYHRFSINNSNNLPQRFAYNYYLTWSASCLFLASFICMNLDLCIQSFVKPIPWFSSIVSDPLLSCCRVCIQCGRRYKRRKSHSTKLVGRHSPSILKRNQSIIEPREEVIIKPIQNGGVTLVAGQLRIPAIRLSTYEDEPCGKLSEAVTENAIRREEKIPSVFSSSSSQSQTAMDTESILASPISMPFSVMASVDDCHSMNSRYDGDWI